jgi:hypothetical protein
LSLENSRVRRLSLTDPEEDPRSRKRRTYRGNGENRWRCSCRRACRCQVGLHSRLDPYPPWAETGESGDVCVCIILTASKKGIIKTLQHSHCLVQISDGITRWQRETEGERTEKLPAPTIDLSIHLKLASDEANGGRSRNRATNLGVVGATG